MASIYSQKLANRTFASGASLVLYTVPTNYTVVVTDVDFISIPSGANEEVYVTLGVCIVLYHKTPSTDVTTHQWVGKQVLNGGDRVTLNAAVGLSGSIAVTGYVLAPL